MLHQTKVSSITKASSMSVSSVASFMTGDWRALSSSAHTLFSSSSTILSSPSSPPPSAAAMSSPSSPSASSPPSAAAISSSSSPSSAAAISPASSISSPSSSSSLSPSSPASPLSPASSSEWLITTAFALSYDISSLSDPVSVTQTASSVSSVFPLNKTSLNPPIQSSISLDVDIFTVTKSLPLPLSDSTHQSLTRGVTTETSGTKSQVRTPDSAAPASLQSHGLYGTQRTTSSNRIDTSPFTTWKPAKTEPNHSTSTSVTSGNVPFTVSARTIRSSDNRRTRTVFTNNRETRSLLLSSHVQDSQADQSQQSVLQTVRSALLSPPPTPPQGYLVPSLITGENISATQNRTNRDKTWTGSQMAFIRSAWPVAVTSVPSHAVDSSVSPAVTSRISATYFPISSNTLPTLSDTDSPHSDTTVAKLTGSYWSTASPQSSTYFRDLVTATGHTSSSTPDPNRNNDEGGRAGGEVSLDSTAQTRSHPLSDSTLSSVSGTLSDSTLSSVSGTLSDSTLSSVSGTLSDSTLSSVSGTLSDSTLSSVSGTLSDSTPSSVSGTLSDSTLSSVSGTLSESTLSSVSGTSSDSILSSVSGTPSDSTLSSVSGTLSDSTPSSVSGTLSVSPMSASSVTLGDAGLTPLTSLTPSLKSDTGLMSLPVTDPSTLAQHLTRALTSPTLHASPSTVPQDPQFTLSIILSTRQPYFNPTVSSLHRTDDAPTQSASRGTTSTHRPVVLLATPHATSPSATQFQTRPLYISVSTGSEVGSPDMTPEMSLDKSAEMSPVNSSEMSTEMFSETSPEMSLVTSPVTSPDITHTPAENTVSQPNTETGSVLPLSAIVEDSSTTITDLSVHVYKGTPPLMGSPTPSSDVTEDSLISRGTNAEGSPYPRPTDIPADVNTAEAVPTPLKHASHRKTTTIRGKDVLSTMSESPTVMREYPTPSQTPLINEHSHLSHSDIDRKMGVSSTTSSTYFNTITSDTEGLPTKSLELNGHSRYLSLTPVSSHSPDRAFSAGASTLMSNGREETFVGHTSVTYSKVRPLPKPWSLTPANLMASISSTTQKRTTENNTPLLEGVTSALSVSMPENNTPLLEGVTSALSVSMPENNTPLLEGVTSALSVSMPENNTPLLEGVTSALSVSMPENNTPLLEGVTSALSVSMPENNTPLLEGVTSALSVSMPENNTPLLEGVTSALSVSMPENNTPLLEGVTSALSVSMPENNTPLLEGVTSALSVSMPENNTPLLEGVTSALSVSMPENNTPLLSSLSSSSSSSPSSLSSSSSSSSLPSSPSSPSSSSSSAISSSPLSSSYSALLSMTSSSSVVSHQSHISSVSSLTTSPSLSSLSMEHSDSTPSSTSGLSLSVMSPSPSSVFPSTGMTSSPSALLSPALTSSSSALMSRGVTSSPSSLASSVTSSSTVRLSTGMMSSSSALMSRGVTSSLISLASSVTSSFPSHLSEEVSVTSVLV
ncbi:mucin-2-like, partial [Salvelinus alpinus]|uniref:mucin-2-like n=1 Tax=Salvelinus alpinus TaxID=8036 RepID=UPI0039FC00DA